MIVNDVPLFNTTYEICSGRSEAMKTVNKAKAKITSKSGLHSVKYSKIKKDTFKSYMLTKSRFNSKPYYSFVGYIDVGERECIAINKSFDLAFGAKLNTYFTEMK